MTSSSRFAGRFREAVVEIRPALVARVPALVARYTLRAYDAIQLAAAITVRQTGLSVELSGVRTAIWSARRPLKGFVS